MSNTFFFSASCSWKIHPSQNLWNEEASFTLPSFISQVQQSRLSLLRGKKANTHYWACPLLGMCTTHYWACPLLGMLTGGHTHYWACPLLGMPTNWAHSLVTGKLLGLGGVTTSSHSHVTGVNFLNTTGKSVPPADFGSLDQTYKT